MVVVSKGGAANGGCLSGSGGSARGFEGGFGRGGGAGCSLDPDKVRDHAPTGAERDQTSARESDRLGARP